MNHPVLMGAHENDQKRKPLWSRRGLVVSSREELLELKFAPNFNSWPKLVRRLENYGYSCEVKLAGKTLSVSTKANLQNIQTLLGDRRKTKKATQRLIILAPVLVVLGALSFSLQAENDSTAFKTQRIPEKECGTQYLTRAIVSDSPDPKILDRTSSRMGGIESGTFVCGEDSYNYTLELNEPKRVIILLKLDS